MRWYGGKWRLAKWIVAQFPPHRVYVEPFGGAASVLIQKPRSYAEVYNDLDKSAVALFRILRSGRAEDLVSAVELTPFSRTEYESAALDLVDDDLELARRLMVRAFMGFGSNATQKSSGFRNNTTRSHTTGAEDWRNMPGKMPAIIERFRGVVIENMPALDLIEKFDGRETLFYLDPPYLPETRGRVRRYKHEMSQDDHAEFLAAADKIEGMAVISGYPSEMYDRALAGWDRIERAALADGARERIEVLWTNPAGGKARLAGPLFRAAQ